MELLEECFFRVLLHKPGFECDFSGREQRKKKNHTHDGHLKRKTLTQTLACASPSLGLVIHQVEMKRLWDLVSPK